VLRDLGICLRNFTGTFNGILTSLGHLIQFHLNLPVSRWLDLSSEDEAQQITMGKGLVRDDSRVLIHFDYDCFYASVVENENPALKSLPLAIQQKQIVVTCNYEARKRGLRKLQLITEAKRVCPEAVIVLGEDLTRFRHASKELYNWLRAATWSDRVERLGFDEVWYVTRYVPAFVASGLTWLCRLDVTDMIEHNIGLLNSNDLSNSFFCMEKDDPTVGFVYDASNVFGPTFPPRSRAPDQVGGLVEAGFDPRLRRLILGSHLAAHLRHELEKEKGYTATVGIATNKLLSKLVGNVNKPHNQTTLVPPYEEGPTRESSISIFLDAHDIGKVPGIGFKLAQKIRAHVLGRVANIDEGLVYGGTLEKVSVRDVRLCPGMGPELLEELLSGPGSQKGIGGKMWELLHGIDNSEVGKAKRVPSQISQEDSYMKYLRTFEDVRKQLLLLAERLIIRMHLDLMEDDDEDGEDIAPKRRWLAHPRTLRLSTRPRPPRNADGTRARTFHRISRSAPFPKFAFSLTENVSVLAERLVETCLAPMFRQLHPQQTGFNISLVNIACTNMNETAADTKDSDGRDIGRMFKKQDDVLKDFKVSDQDEMPVAVNNEALCDKKDTPLTEIPDIKETTTMDAWDEDDEDGWLSSDRWAPSSTNSATGQDTDAMFRCPSCHTTIPAFASMAHMRYHDLV
jgi:DNA polymerase iota